MEQANQCHVFPDGHGPDKAIFLPVLGQKPNTVPNRLYRFIDRNFLPIKVQLAGLLGQRSKDRTDQFRTAGADQA